jgi:hypothetical protein
MILDESFVENYLSFDIFYLEYHSKSKNKVDSKYFTYLNGATLESKYLIRHKNYLKIYTDLLEGGIKKDFSDWNLKHKTDLASIQRILNLNFKEFTLVTIFIGGTKYYGVLHKQTQDLTLIGYESNLKRKLIINYWFCIKYNLINYFIKREVCFYLDTFKVKFNLKTCLEKDYEQV